MVYVQEYEQPEYERAEYVQRKMFTPHQSISIRYDGEIHVPPHRVSIATSTIHFTEKQKQTQLQCDHQSLSLTQL